MEDSKHIKDLVNEADIYRKQGLLKEAEGRYKEALQIVRNHEVYSKDKKAIEAIQKRIGDLHGEAKEIGQADENPQLPMEVQDLIKKLFAFSEDEDNAALEGALALMKFGQYEKAVVEFKGLIEEKILPLGAAKNIFRCHMAMSSYDNAVSQFKEWAANKTFPDEELARLGGFLKNMLEKRGVKFDPGKFVQAAPEKEAAEEMDAGDIEISAVNIQLEKGPRKGQVVEFEVTVQSGNSVSFVVRSNQKELIDAFEEEDRLYVIQCYSSLAVFNAHGVVSKKMRIPSGPRQGDYTLDVLLEME